MLIPSRFDAVKRQAVCRATRATLPTENRNHALTPPACPIHLTRCHAPEYRQVTMKKQTLLFAGILAFAVLIGAGCGTLLTQPASPASLPVLTGAATTNDVNLIAYELLLKQANTSLNPTSTNAPVNTALDGLIALSGLVAGWYARHKGIGTTSTAPPPTTKV